MSNPLEQLPDSGCGPVGSTPVFNCIVLFRSDEDTGAVSGRLANLPDCSAEASDERQLLIVLTRKFRDHLRKCAEAGTTPALSTDEIVPAAGEQQRFIPIHL